MSKHFQQSTVWWMSDVLKTKQHFVDVRHFKTNVVTGWGSLTFSTDKGIVAIDILKTNIALCVWPSDIFNRQTTNVVILCGSLTVSV